MRSGVTLTGDEAAAVAGLLGLSATTLLLLFTAYVVLLIIARWKIFAKAGRGVLVKAPKSKQDLRFDLPTIGPRTVEGAATAGIAGIAVIAGNTLAAEPQALIEAADAKGLFVIGLAG